VNKKIKPNRFKPEENENTHLQPGPSAGSSAGIDFYLKCIMVVAFVSILSLGSIFIFDLVTQSNFFSTKKVEITGINRVLKDEILDLAELTSPENIFSLNLYNIEEKITSHPWIQSAKVKRSLSLNLLISIIEQKPLAIVKIENLADILINTNGRPFKEYNPQKDQLDNLPIITGLDLTHENNRYMFNGTLFNSIMDFLKSDKSDNVLEINSNGHTGITIKTLDTFNQVSSNVQETILLKLGFNNFDAKLYKAKTISEYIDKHFPDRTICAIDIFDIEKVFIKTKLSVALHDNLAKGV
jgi:cell division protein FtsQ